MATPKQNKPLLLENKVYVVALTPGLQRVSIYSVIDFFYHNYATEPILLLILIKGF